MFGQDDQQTNNVAQNTNNQPFGAPAPSPLTPVVQPATESAPPVTGDSMAASVTAAANSMGGGSSNNFGNPVPASLSQPLETALPTNPNDPLAGWTPPSTDAPAVDSGTPSDTNAFPTDATQDQTNVAEDTPVPSEETASDNPSTSSELFTGGDDQLATMKQAALEQLQPLIPQLDQGPEEQFKTLMMMIQATDDQSMLDKAFETAKQITNDKARANALLDIVNEINYFSQK